MELHENGQSEEPAAAAPHKTGKRTERAPTTNRIRLRGAKEAAYPRAGETVAEIPELHERAGEPASPGNHTIRQVCETAIQYLDERLEDVEHVESTNQPKQVTDFIFISSY